MQVQVLVRLKAGVLDVQGKAVEHALSGVGLEGISQVRIGKLIEFELEASDQTVAKERAEALCERLLANTVIENYQIIFPV